MHDSDQSDLGRFSFGSDIVDGLEAGENLCLTGERRLTPTAIESAMAD